MSTSQVVHERPNIQLDFQSRTAAATLPPTLSTGELTPTEPRLPPTQLAGAGHIENAPTTETELGKIEEYATTKTSVLGFIFKGIFSLGIHSLYNLYLYSHNRNLACQYLQGKGINPNQVLAKMPWNASRSLSVLCLLIKNGLPPNQVTELFQKEPSQLDDAVFVIRNCPDISVDAIKQLAQCRTSTFLKQVANSVVAAAIRNLHHKIEENGADKDQAITDILKLAKTEAIWQSTDAEIQYRLLQALTDVTENAQGAQKQQAIDHILALAETDVIRKSTNIAIQSKILSALSLATQNAQGTQKQQAIDHILELTETEAIRQPRYSNVYCSLLSALTLVTENAQGTQKQTAIDHILLLAQPGAPFLDDKIDFTRASLTEALTSVTENAQGAEQKQALRVIEQLSISQTTQDTNSRAAG